MNIHYQLELRPELLTIYGPSDYLEFRDQLEEINRLLEDSGAEDRFLVDFILKNKKYAKKIPFLRTALRTMILLTLTNESYRSLAFRLADSDLFRWFICVNTLTGAKTPSKSTIQRFEHLWSKEEIGTFIHDLTTTVTLSNQSEKLLFGDTPIEITHCYADSTCIQANIHHPVDWVLFRDAIRTLIGSIKLIRSQGLLHRMELPETYLSRINSMSIAMTQASNNRTSKKERKRIFRQMKKLLKKIEKHGERYYSLLSDHWEITTWSKAQADQVLQRMSNILEQIPSIIKLAHSRIISEKKVKNSDKILSLYEKDVHVIKRGKMDAAVEFGNGFYLAEQQDGIIVDWDFFGATQKSDTQLVKESIERITENYIKPEWYTTDRGFNSKGNDIFLEENGVNNGTCPRNPQELIVKMKDDTFRGEQKRRSQTEGRIGIFKNKFIGRKIRRKGVDNREIKILWSILTHNLWVLSRIAIENRKEKELTLAKAA
jgi:hypothetical protein